MLFRSSVRVTVNGVNYTSTAVPVSVVSPQPLVISSNPTATYEGYLLAECGTTVELTSSAGPNTVWLYNNNTQQFTGSTLAIQASDLTPEGGIIDDAINAYVDPQQGCYTGSQFVVAFEALAPLTISTSQSMPATCGDRKSTRLNSSHSSVSRMPSSA